MDPVTEWMRGTCQLLIDETIRWEKLKYEIHGFKWLNSEDQAHMWWRIDSWVDKEHAKKVYRHHVHNIHYENI